VEKKETRRSWFFKAYLNPK